MRPVKMRKKEGGAGVSEIAKRGKRRLPSKEAKETKNKSKAVSPLDCNAIMVVSQMDILVCVILFLQSAVLSEEEWGSGGWRVCARPTPEKRQKEQKQKRGKPQ